MNKIIIVIKKMAWRKAQRKYAAAVEAYDDSGRTRGRNAVDAAEAEMHQTYKDYARSMEAVPGETGSTWD